MSFKFSSGAPTDTAQKLAEWLPHPPPASNKLVPKQNEELADGPEVGAGYKVHYLSTEALAHTAKLEEAIAHSRWRHQVKSRGDTLGEIELDENTTPACLYQGPAKEGLARALEIAEAMTESYEATVLMAAPLHFTGLWLHNAQEDLVIPFAPNMTALKNDIAIPLAEALQCLQTLAQNRPAQDEESDQAG